MNLNSYVSVFKIGGSPILPPMMNEHIRRQMKQYKDQAIAIEKQITENKLNDKQENQTLIDTNPEASIFKNFEEISLIEKPLNYSQSETDEPDKSTESTAEDYPETILTISDLQDSMSLKEFSETMSINENGRSQDNNNVETNPEINNSILSNVDCESNNIYSKSSPPRLIRSNSYTLDNPSPLFVRHMMSQGLNINSTPNNPPTADNTSKPSAPIPPNEVPTISINLPSKTTVPLQKNKIFTKSSSKTDKSTIKCKSHVARKIKPKIEITSNARASSTSTTKLAEMVYKQKCASKEKINSLPSTMPSAIAKGKVPHKCVVTGTKLKPITHQFNSKLSKSMDLQQSVTQNLSSSISSLSSNQRENDDKILKFLRNFEEERNAQMLDLIERQKIEQKQMHENFLRQQTMLIKQITENCSNIFANNCQQQLRQKQEETNAAPPPQPPPLTVNESVVMSSPYSDCSSYVTTSSVDQTNNNSIFKRSLNENSRASCNRQLFSDECIVDKIVSNDNDKKNSAATIINAYARGYLVRRLFKTEDVQNIIKIIRDTLIFILNLHQEEDSEEKQKNSSADITLKHNLLQQLNSACYSLHDIFFSKCTSEQMKIISNDRRLLQQKMNKLISMKSSTTDNNKLLNNLKKVSLFQISISSNNADEKTLNSQSEDSIFL